MMKNINWKKYAGAAMAAAMIPALVAPIATEASGSFSVTEGKNIVITIDGELALVGEESAQWFDKKQIKLVSTENGKTYTADKNGIIWVPATYNKGIVYDVYDLNGKKTSMTVWPSGSTKAVLDYSAEVKAEAEAKEKNQARRLVYLSPGYNIKITEDGKEANNLFNEKVIRLVNTENPDQYYSLLSNGLFAVPEGQTYDIYDLTGMEINANTHKGLEPKGQITVDWNAKTTIATLNYHSLEALKKSVEDLKAEIASVPDTKNKTAKSFFQYELVLEAANYVQQTVEYIIKTESVNAQQINFMFDAVDTAKSELVNGETNLVPLPNEVVDKTVFTEAITALETELSKSVDPSADKYTVESIDKFKSFKQVVNEELEKAKNMLANFDTTSQDLLDSQKWNLDYTLVALENRDLMLVYRQ